MWFWSRDFFVSRAQAVKTASDTLDACRAEEQGAEFFSGEDRLGDRRREHVEKFRFVSGEVLHLCGVEFGFVVVHSFNLSEKLIRSSDFFDLYLPERKGDFQVARNDLHAIFFPDGAFVVLGDEAHALHGVEDFFFLVGSFCYHAYTIPQNREKARDFFCDCENIFYFFA